MQYWFLERVNFLKSVFLFCCVFIGMIMTGCNATKSSIETEKDEAEQYSDTYRQPIVFAMNIGGSAHTGVDGIYYQVDNLPLSASKKQSSNILGSQDNQLFESYREGDIQISVPVPSGIYDVTLKFAEPNDIAVGDRVFDVQINGQTALEKLDVRLGRDGRHLSSLVKTVTGFQSTNGSINIELKAVKGKPVLHGLIIKQQLPDPKKWELVWSDEFDYEGRPDDSKWSHDLWPARKVNDEDQAYTNRSKNTRVENGRLIIEAHKEQYDNAEYTSGRLHALGKGDFLYGKAEIRAKLPKGQGTWSAIWMLPSDPYKYATTCKENEDWQGSHTCNAWPNSGEIDIMEHVGYDMHNVHGTVHTNAYFWLKWNQRKASVDGKNVDEAFHVYGLEWTPEHIIISMDGSPYFFYKNERKGWEAWPFDHPYHLILNLAIGGEWGRAGGPIDDSIFPVQMEVDYVRIFQHPDLNP